VKKALRRSVRRKAGSIGERVSHKFRVRKERLLAKWHAGRPLNLKRIVARNRRLAKRYDAMTKAVLDAVNRRVMEGLEITEFPEPEGMLITVRVDVSKFSRKDARKLLNYLDARLAKLNVIVGEMMELARLVRGEFMLANWKEKQRFAEAVKELEEIKNSIDVDSVRRLKAISKAIVAYVHEGKKIVKFEVPYEEI